MLLLLLLTTTCFISLCFFAQDFQLVLLNTLSSLTQTTAIKDTMNSISIFFVPFSLSLSLSSSWTLFDFSIISFCAPKIDLFSLAVLENMGDEIVLEQGEKEEGEGGQEQQRDMFFSPRFPRFRHFVLCSLQYFEHKHELISCVQVFTRVVNKS